MINLVIMSKEPSQRTRMKELVEARTSDFNVIRCHNPQQMTQFYQSDKGKLAKQLCMVIDDEMKACGLDPFRDTDLPAVQMSTKIMEESTFDNAISGLRAWFLAGKKREAFVIRRSKNDDFEPGSIQKSRPNNFRNPIVIKESHWLHDDFLISALKQCVKLFNTNK
jgi:hypothetical protein